MQLFYRRHGGSVVAWRQSGSVPVAATLAPRDCHRRIVSRGNRIRISAGYTAAGPTSVTSDLAASYSLQGTTSADAAASYNVRAAVVSDLGTGYEVLSAGVVQSGLTAAYNIRAAATADLNAAYTIDGDSFFTAQSRSRIGPSALRVASRIGPQSLAAKTRIGEPAL